MDEENKSDVQIDQNQNGEDQKTDDNKSEGGANDTSKVKIGDTEYTTEELAKYIDKGSKYDDLLPDYTRKSQELAEHYKTKGQDKHEDIPPYLKPDWEPKSYKELQEAIIWAKETGKIEALKTLEQKELEANNQKQSVDNFFAEIKKTDKNFDEQDFSEFVVKHTKDRPSVTIDDLKSFHSVYKEVQDARKLGESQAQKNQSERSEKVNSNSGSGKSNIDFSDLRGRGDMRDIAKSAFDRLNK